MAFIIFAAFVVVPLIEIALFVIVGQEIGLWATLAVVILTAMAGTALLRAQGAATLRQAQTHLNQGEMPVEQVFTSVFLLVAGALLLTPGFFTDALGFLLFVPPVRAAVGRAVFRALLRNANVKVYMAPGSGGFGPRGSDPDDTVIDAEFRPVDPEDDNRNGHLPKS